MIYIFVNPTMFKPMYHNTNTAQMNYGTSGEINVHNGINIVQLSV